VRRCPGCGCNKFGWCPQCFPAEAEAEKAAEIAAWRREQEQQERRSAGMIRCPEHGEYDRCWKLRRPLTWQRAMAELRRRYVPPA
jgi:hypothetical protein